eukprot:scaffold996_cov190-Alexandrium_tamarense.AAC.6
MFGVSNEGRGWRCTGGGDVVFRWSVVVWCGSRRRRGSGLPLPAISSVDGAYLSRPPRPNSRHATPEIEFEYSAYSLKRHTRMTSQYIPSAPGDVIVPAMEKIDPFLRFLTKATSTATVPLALLQSILPKNLSDGDVGVIAGTDDSSCKTDRTRHGDSSTATSEAATSASGNRKEVDSRLNEILSELSFRGVLNYHPDKQTVGFPLPPSSADTTSNAATTNTSLPTPPAKLIGKGLHGSTEAVAKRRMKVLKWTLEREPSWACKRGGVSNDEAAELDRKPSATSASKPVNKKEAKKSMQTDHAISKDSSKLIVEQAKGEDKHSQQHSGDLQHDNSERSSAYKALHNLLSNDGKDENSAQIKPSKNWLPCQAAYAGSHPGRIVEYGALTKDTLDKIPSDVLELFRLDVNDISEESTTKRSDISKHDKDSTHINRRRLFQHQTQAIEAAMNDIHTVVCTGTGSGKTMCFLLPVIAKALASPGSASILLFPTKALAQDQYSKIKTLLQSLPNEPSTDIPPLHAGVIDGDTPHAQRDAIATDCQIILTNPDTIHAALLPSWKRPSYKQLLARIDTVVIDEAHVYDGTFGAHVAMVLSRLKRVCRVASSSNSIRTADNAGNSPRNAKPLFIACSATITHPEQQFRLLCPVKANEKVCVIEKDGSPSSPKHYFVWNPPILDLNGNCTGSVFLPKKIKSTDNNCLANNTANDNISVIHIPRNSSKRKRNSALELQEDESISIMQYNQQLNRRRHAADETALLFARAIVANTRCIAFCRTRSLVEWVYERTITALKSCPESSHLASRIESYRGGYSAQARRSIEERLFKGDLIGVVGTNALELGVDVGGIDLTLHCGYPGSKSSLLQQSGRAGRGRGVPSCSVTICFSSPSEQFLWRTPNSLLRRGVDVPPSLPLNGSVVQGHLLAAGAEFPLCGVLSVTTLLNEHEESITDCPSDEELLGGQTVYQESVELLMQKGGLLTTKLVHAVSAAGEKCAVFETHPVVKDAWKRVSLRSIEPVNYSIVDLSHPMQGGMSDKIHSPAAVMDSIPYSRVRLFAPNVALYFFS